MANSISKISEEVVSPHTLTMSIFMCLCQGWSTQQRTDWLRTLTSATQPFCITWRKLAKSANWTYGHHINGLTLTINATWMLGQDYCLKSGILIGWKMWLFQIKKWYLYASMKYKGNWTDKGCNCTISAKVWPAWKEVHGSCLVKCEGCDSLGNAGMQSVHEHSNALSPNAKCGWCNCTKIQNWLSCSLMTTLNHVAKLTLEKFLKLLWKDLPQLPYSPNLVPTDYHLFQALQNFLNGKIFATDDEVKTANGNFFNNKPAEFCNKAIHDLLCHRKQIIDNNRDDPGVWYMPFTVLYHCILLFIKAVRELSNPILFNFLNSLLLYESTEMMTLNKGKEKAKNYFSVWADDEKTLLILVAGSDSSFF